MNLRIKKVFNDEESFKRFVFWKYLLRPKKRREIVEHEMAHANMFREFGYLSPVYGALYFGPFLGGFAVSHEGIERIPRGDLRKICLAPLRPSREDYELVYEIDCERGLEKFEKFLKNSKK